MDKVVAAILAGVQAINNLTKQIALAFPAGTGTAASATGGSATLPSNPVGFITTTLPGSTTVVKVPYYS